MVNELKKLFGKGYETGICKVKFGKGYWLEGKIVDLNGTELTVEVPTYYNPTVQTVKVDVKDVMKIKKETK